jgi:radical SAM protein with 4Fe4S-binding SPASM domain
MIINLNFADLKNMQKLAGDLGAEFKFDCHINPRIDGRDSPFKYRLPLETIVDLELEGEKNFLAYKEVFQKFWGRGLKDSFICTAGINSFNINPYGMLSPCTLFFSFKYSLRVMPFRDAWKRLVEDYGMGPNEYIYPECKACNMVLICPRCPAWAEIETKRLSGKLEYLCEYALFLEKKFFEREKEEARYAEKTLPEAPA